MRRFIFLFLAISATLMALSAAAETLEPTAEHFKEELRPAALISGSLVAGFQRATTSEENLTISSIVPPSWSDQIVCVRVWTANGRYEAQNEYLVPSLNASSELLISFPTEHEEFLLSQTSEEVATLTSLGSCDGPADIIALSHWNANTGNIQLLLNSFRSDLVFVYVGDSIEPIQCSPLEAEIRSAYDVVCDIAEGSLSETTKLQIFRYTNQQSAEPVTLTIIMPSEG